MDTALAGCTGEHDWDTWWIILAVLHFNFGAVFLAAPLDKAPWTGNWKYLLLHPWALVKDATERDWDPLLQVYTLGIGAHWLTLGLFAVWATGQDDNFTYGAVVTTFGALGVVCWIAMYYKYASQLSIAAFVPLNFQLGFVILGAMLAAEHKTDQGQLRDSPSDVSAGTLLWIIFVLQVVLTVYGAATAFLPTLKETRISGGFKSGIQYDTQLGCTFARGYVGVSAHVALLFLWAAVNYDKDQDPKDFTFPMAWWIGTLIQFVIWASSFILYDHIFFVYGIVVATAIYSAQIATTLTMWETDCR